MSFTFLNFLTFKKKQVRTFFGWTPGFRVLVRGFSLPCGCLVGCYETWVGEDVEVVDATAASCRNTDHAINVVLRRLPQDDLVPQPPDNAAPRAGA